MDIQNTQVHEESINRTENPDLLNGTKPEAEGIQVAEDKAPVNGVNPEVETEGKVGEEVEGQKDKKEEPLNNDKGAGATANDRESAEGQAIVHLEVCNKVDEHEKAREEDKTNTKGLIPEHEQDKGTNEVPRDNPIHEEKAQDQQAADLQHTDQAHDNEPKKGDDLVEDLKGNNKDAETHLDEDNSEGSNKLNGNPTKDGCEQNKKDPTAIVDENHPEEPEGHRHKRVKTSE